MTTIARPQPLGVLPLPAGWLVLPADVVATQEGGAARDRLVGGMLPEPWPAALAAVELAAAGRTVEAAALVDPTAGPEHAYNHFVLTGEPGSLALARAGVAAAAGDPQPNGDLAALVAVAAFALGHDDAVPDPDGAHGHGPVDGELRAHVLAARAAAHLERGDVQAALDTLVAAEEAARPVSAVLAAMLLGQQAGLLQQVNGADPDVVQAYVDAVDALRGLTAVESTMGELALGLGTAYQELAAQRSAEAEGPPSTGASTATSAGASTGASAGTSAGAGLLVEAVRCYHLALRMLRADVQPERYAFAHSNLALCYLAMPMGEARDKLRRGVAVQSLREALKFYTREEYPTQWASVTLNLANALQHLPTTHPVENLVEAVGMYDELLAVRTAAADPTGHARALANQGTALAHLGIHDQARLKLDAARELFLAHGDAGSVATVDAALADVTTAASAGAGLG